MYRMFTGRFANQGIPKAGRRGLAQARRRRSRSTRRSPRRSTRLILACLEISPERRPDGMFEVQNQLSAVAKAMGLQEVDLKGADDKDLKRRPAARTVCRPCGPAASTMNRTSAAGGRDVPASPPSGSRLRLGGKEPMQYNPANPLIVQGDRTVLLEVDNPLHAEARDAIAPFAELEKSPEHIHTYRLTPALALERRRRRDVGRRDGRRAGHLQQVPAPAQPADRPPRAGQPLRPGQPPAGRRRSSG